MPACKYMEEIGSAAMLAIKRLAGVTPEVNLREHVTYMPLPSMNKAAYFGFETQGRHPQKSKIGLSVAPQKGLVFSKNFKKMFSSTSLRIYIFSSSRCTDFMSTRKS